MSVVADASVLIFPGKIRRLDWIPRLFPPPLYVPDLVRQEVLIPDLPPSEQDYLEDTLKPWETVPWRPRISRLSGGLSVTDISVIEVARQVKAEWVLADERALREVLRSRRHHVIGTLGILLLAVRRGIDSPAAVKGLVDELIRSHRFRISADTYRHFLQRLEETSQPT